MAQPRRPAALSRDRSREWQELSGSRPGTGRRERERGSHQRPRRGDRPGRRPDSRLRTVRGALLLSTQGGDLDQIVEAQRLAILKVFLVAAAIMSVLSILLAGTIAGPVRRLADSAERVRRRVRGRVEIPDFTQRRDEIGDLSGNLREMTSALYSRIEAIESFAADVAHELKNPLTSLRSAVETLPLAKTESSRSRLLGVLKHHVHRLHRPLSPISDARPPH